MGSQKFKNTRYTNSDIHTVSNIMKNVMGSAEETESGALFQNGQEAEHICSTLHKMGHLQPETPMKTDNSTANCIVKNTVCETQSKATNMCFYRIQY